MEQTLQTLMIVTGLVALGLVAGRAFLAARKSAAPVKVPVRVRPIWTRKE